MQPALFASLSDDTIEETAKPTIYEPKPEPEPDMALPEIAMDIEDLR